MVNHFKQNVSKLDETPQDKIGVSATVGSQGEKPKEGGGIEFRVDWFQGTFESKHLEKVHKLVSKFFNGEEFEEATAEEVLKGATDQFKERCFGIRYFAKSYSHPSGALSGVGHKLPGGMVDESLAYIELTGDVLLKIKQSQFRKLMRALRDIDGKFKCTRDDLTLDDYDKSFQIEWVKEAYDRHWYTGFRDTGDYREFGRYGSKGKQFSIGNRGSKGGGKRMVFYDKDAESKGEIEAYRIELSCYDHYAQQSFEQLCDTPYLCWGEVIGGWISGAIDFRKRKGEKDKNPGRRKRLEWWASLIEKFPKMKPSREYKNSDLESLKEWFVKQVSPSVAVFMCAMNNPKSAEPDEEFWKFFWDAVADGASRFREKHYYLINSC